MNTKNKPVVHRWELWGLAIVSLLAMVLIVLFWPGAFFVILKLGIEADWLSLTVFISFLGGTLTLLLLLGGAAWQSVRRLQGDAARATLQLNLPPRFYLWLGVFWLGSLLGGRWLAEGQQAHLLWMSLLHWLAVFLPVVFALAWALNGLRLGAPLRVWGTLAIGALFAPLLSALFELLLLLTLGAVVTAILLENPSAWQEFTALINALQAPMTDYAMQTLVQTLLQRYPQINFLWMAYLALAIPLTEELLKPLGVWLLGNRLRSPAQGFVLGALSGAVFAWYENLMSASALLSGAWLENVLLRALTPVIHILASALVGWGIALWGQRGDWKAFAGLFSLAFVLHGAWNGVSGLLVLQHINAWANLSDEWLALVINAIFGVLYVIGLLALRWLNTHWRRQQGVADLFAEAPIH